MKKCNLSKGKPSCQKLLNKYIKHRNAARRTLNQSHKNIQRKVIARSESLVVLSKASILIIYPVQYVVSEREHFGQGTIKQHGRDIASASVGLAGKNTLATVAGM